MNGNCSYHPTRKAHWICPECETMFCPDCISTRERGVSKKQQAHFCPKCNVEAEWVGAANLIPPFWNRLPQFFTYAFYPRPLLLNLTVSFISVFIFTSGFFSGLIRFFLWGIMVKYAFAALKNTAGGDLRPPKVDTPTISDDFGIVFKQLGLYLLLGIGILLAFVYLGLFPGIVVLLFAVLFFPAMLMVLVTTSRLTVSLNPAVFVRIASRIGGAYFIMYLFLILLGGAPGFLAYSVIKYFPSGVDAFLIQFIQNYYTLVTYHLMGYVLLQYHVELGYHVDYENFCDVEDEKGKVSEQTPADRKLQEVERLIREGEFDKALELLRMGIKSESTRSVPLMEKYYKLLEMKGLKEEADQAAPAYLDLLVEEGRRHAACLIYLDRVSRMPKIRIPARSLFSLGEWLSASGDVREGLAAYHRLIKTHPNDNLVPRAYFEAARIYNDRMTDPEKAKRILSGVVKKYPDHDVIPTVRDYLENSLTL